METNKVKTKKVGICRREILVPEIKGSFKQIIQKAELGKLSLTDGDIKSGIRSSLRELWRASTRAVFLEGIRRETLIEGKHRLSVKCKECKRVMWIGAKERVKLKNGKLSKKAKSVFQVDHVHGCHPFTEYEDLGKFAKDLFHGELRVLCYSCHQSHTDKQSKAKRS